MRTLPGSGSPNTLPACARARHLSTSWGRPLGSAVRSVSFHRAQALRKEALACVRRSRAALAYTVGPSVSRATFRGKPGAPGAGLQKAPRHPEPGYLSLCAL